MIEELGYGYLYHYNSYTGEYLCFSRDAMEQVFSGTPSSKFKISKTHYIASSKLGFEKAAERMYEYLNQE